MGFVGNDLKNGIWMTLNGGALLVSVAVPLLIYFHSYLVLQQFILNASL